jgi:hypothetical protein
MPTLNWCVSSGELWFPENSNASALGSTYDNAKRYPVYYLDDECKINSNSIWANTTVLFASSNPSALPIVDAALRDTGSVGSLSD